jgi:RNA polymerase sigma factor (sigma-70 family)
VFLTLSRKARSLRGGPSIAGWLHRVARNVSRNALRARSLRKQREREAAEMAEERCQQEGQWQRIEGVLDEDLDALPEKYRTAIVVFHLEGRSLEETAALLAVKSSTLGTRLSRGRELLRSRLAPRGITISVAALAVLLTEKASAAAVPLAFTTTTVKAAALFAAGKAAAGGLVSAQAAAPTQRALKMMYAARLKLAAAIVVAATVVTGGGVAVYHVTGGNGANAAPAATIAQVDPAEPATEGAAAGKPIVPITAGVSQAPIIVVGTVQASRGIANSERLPDGTWTTHRTRVAARVTEIIKGYAAPEIEFDVLGLGFDSGKSYVLLLDQEQLEITDRFGKRKVLGLVWSPGVKRRVEATPENVTIIKRAADE